MQVTTRLLYALIFFFALIHGPAQGAEVKESGTVAARVKSKKKTPRPSSQFEVPDDDNLPYDTTPRTLRKEPLVGLGATVGYYYIGVGLGADVWWNTPHRPLDVGVRFTQAQGELTSKDTDGIPLREVLDTEMTSLSLYGRYFLGDALNVTGALTQASLAGTYGYKSLDANVHSTFVDFESQRLMLELSLGHQWRLVTGHVFAIDWIGFGAALGEKLTLGSDNPAPDGTKVQDRVTFFEDATVEDHVKKQLKDQVFVYVLVFKFGTEF